MESIEPYTEKTNDKFVMSIIDLEASLDNIEKRLDAFIAKDSSPSHVR